MVCVPCFIIPVLLYIWHKFLQPILLRYWNPWEKKDAEGNVIKSGPEFPFQCKGNACPFPIKKNKSIANDGSATTDDGKVAEQEEKLNADDGKATSEAIFTDGDDKKIN